MAESEIPVEVTETVAAWIAGAHFPDRNWENLNLLIAQVEEDPELWWRAIAAAIPDLDPENSSGVERGLLAALLQVGGKDWGRRLAADAQHDSRLASLLSDAVSFLGRASPKWRDGPTAYELLGRDLVVDTWVRHCGEGPDPKRARKSGRDWDFWAWTVVHDLVWSIDADEAWEVILAIVDRAPNDWVLGCVGAGPLEDLLPGRWLDMAEERAKADPRFKVAFNAVRM
jgi:hypothetical protein